MATSVVPALIDALVAAATTALPDVLVFDGIGVTDDPGDFLMVGVEDPDIEGAAFSADTKQDWAAVGTGAPRDEQGDITCVALSWNGDGDPKAARDDAYAIAAALEDLLRDTPALGVPGLLWTSFGTSSQLSQAQGPDGASALLVFRINFRARI
jgi:hypothetical protein